MEYSLCPRAETSLEYAGIFVGIGVLDVEAGPRRAVEPGNPGEADGGKEEDGDAEGVHGRDFSIRRHGVETFLRHNVEKSGRPK